MRLPRRQFLQLAGAAVAAPAFPRVASALVTAASAQAQEPLKVPWSMGTEAPQTKAPPNATDRHHHFYDSRFKTASNAAHPPDATAADYRLLQKRIGIVRHVVVQPVPYGVSNDGLIETLGEFGPTARDADLLPADPNVPPRDPSMMPASGQFRARTFSPEMIDASMPHWLEVYHRLFR
jgi:hypothetical protein